jgi:hypothetical protein
MPWIIVKHIVIEVPFNGLFIGGAINTSLYFTIEIQVIATIVS